jgi:uncharacterized protein DUF4339
VSSQSTTARAAGAELAAAGDEVWSVQTSEGIVRMTLDELDDAFQRGRIGAETRVLTSGMSAWDTLGAVAGLDEPESDTRPGSPVDTAAPPRLELIDGGSFPPTTRVAFSAGGLDWASVVAPDRPLQTGVRHRLSRVPFPLRRCAAWLVDWLALSRPRLLVVGLCVAGAMLSTFFITSLYHLGSSSVRPSAHARRGWISARTIPATAATLERLPVAVAAPAAQSPEPSAASSDDIAVVRPSELRLAPRARAEGRHVRGARAKASTRARRMAAARASKKRRSSPLRSSGRD